MTNGSGTAIISISMDSCEDAIEFVGLSPQQPSRLGLFWHSGHHHAQLIFRFARFAATHADSVLEFLFGAGFICLAVVRSDTCPVSNQLTDQRRRDRIAPYSSTKADHFLAKSGCSFSQIKLPVVARLAHRSVSLVIGAWSLVILYFHPFASRTLIITSRIVFQVRPSSSIALGNMQPSQQMCFTPRLAASLSQ